jgi:hypothetical protein
VKPSTKLILLLVVVILLFIAALVTGIYMNGKGNGGSPTDAIKRDWLKALGGLSALFAPKIVLAPLHCTELPKPGQPAVGLSQQRVDGPFELTEAHPTCAIDIPKDAKHDYRHAELKVSGTGTLATVYVRAQFSADDFPKANRDMKKCFLDGEPLDAFRLELRYAAGAADNSWECWLKQDPNEAISVTVLQDGGRLTLTCNGCKSDSQKIIRMKME